MEFGWLFLLLVGFINSLVIFGVNKATHFEYCHPDDTEEYCKNGIDLDSRMILYRLRLWSLKHIGEFWSKPLFTCPPCMASVHSTYIYWFAMPFNIQSLAIWPFYILMLSGLVSLINSVTKYGNS